MTAALFLLLSTSWQSSFCLVRRDASRRESSRWACSSGRPVLARAAEREGGPDEPVETAGPSKRARQNARRRERQSEKSRRLAEKKAKASKLDSLADELQRLKPAAPPPAPSSSFRIVRRSVADAALPCIACADTFVVTCSRCTGEGRLSPGGWHSKNNINRSKLAGTKWTSIEKTLGYDFFTVHTTRRHEGASSGCARVRTSWLVEVAAAGDPSVRLWVPEEVLADRTAWIAGWKEGIWQVPGGAERLRWLREWESVTCPHCGGAGQVPCPECSGVDRPAAAIT